MTEQVAPAVVEPVAAIVDPAAAVVDPAVVAVVDPAKAAVVDPAAAVTEPVRDPASVTEPPVVPFELKIPEGVELTAEHKAELDAIPEAARQQVLDYALKQRETLTSELKKANDEAVEGWKTAAKADKDFGGDKFEANRALAFKAFETFGTPELKQLLDSSGLGYHPELLKWGAKVGAAMSNDRVVPGGQPANKKPYYDNSPNLK